MPDGYSAQQLNQMKSTVDANLADYRYRIYPGGLTPIWSDEVIVEEPVTGAISITIGSGGEQAEAGKHFEAHSPTLQQHALSARSALSFGVITRRSITGAPGMARAGHTSQWQTHRIAKTRFSSDVKDFFGFDKGCGPEFPQYPGLGAGRHVCQPLLRPRVEPHDGAGAERRGELRQLCQP